MKQLTPPKLNRKTVFVFRSVNKQLGLSTDPTEATMTIVITTVTYTSGGKGNRN